VTIGPYVIDYGENGGNVQIDQLSSKRVSYDLAIGTFPVPNLVPEKAYLVPDRLATRLFIFIFDNHVAPVEVQKSPKSGFATK
jgi:hypothetical protein